MIDIVVTDGGTTGMAYRVEVWQGNAIRHDLMASDEGGQTSRERAVCEAQEIYSRLWPRYGNGLNRVHWTDDEAQEAAAILRRRRPVAEA